jgi:hypothetical protein
VRWQEAGPAAGCSWDYIPVPDWRREVGEGRRRNWGGQRGSSLRKSRCRCPEGSRGRCCSLGKTLCKDGLVLVESIGYEKFSVGDQDGVRIQAVGRDKRHQNKTLIHVAKSTSVNEQKK